MSEANAQAAGAPAPAQAESDGLNSEVDTLAGTAGGEEVEAERVEGDDEQSKEEKQEERKFTQAELDAIVQKRLLKEERRLRRRLEQDLMQQAQAGKAAQEPKRENYQDDDAFVRDSLEHLAEQKARALIEQREVQRRQAEMSERFLSQAEAAQDKYPDFDVVVGNPALQINESMAEFMAVSDLGAEVAYHLGKNPAKAASIARMSPVLAALELKKLEQTLNEKPRRPAPPEPINPVNARGRASSTALPSDADDIETWMAKERKRLAGR